MASLRFSWRKPLGWALVGIVVAAACSGEEETAVEVSTAEKLCTSLAAQLQSCGPATPCDESLVADCTDLTSILSESLMQAMIGCIEEGGSPLGCLMTAIGSTTTTPAHEQFAEKFCSDCALGVPGCDKLFSADAPEQLEPVRNIILALGEDLVAEITAQCTDRGLKCLPGFSSCVQGVLAAQALPEETIDCVTGILLDPPPEPPPSACGQGGAGQGGAGQGGAGQGGAAQGGAGQGGAAQGGNGGSCIGLDGACTTTQDCCAPNDCIMSKCVCPSGLTDCDGSCVDLSSNPAHCNVCGKACTNACDNGLCS